MRSRRFVLPAVIAALVALTGCTPQAAAPESSATNATEPSATPTAPPVVASVLVRAEAVEVLGDDGSTIASATYFDAASTFTEMLTAAFGAAPVVEPDEGGIETPPGTRYTWSGFFIVDRDIDQQEPYDPAITAYVIVPEVNGIRVETVGGYAVGDNAEAVATTYPDEVSRYTLTEGGELLMVRADRVDIPPTGDKPEKRSWAVAVLGKTDGLVTNLIAPSGDFGV
ncbi:hypothetical protein ACL9RL_15885 [Plantibacter sp. Mn2098]|uniref:hypothetical protein n=1 Tax=Plantibacter sp. Mn2098 TaxID=3395266 RepID=UPI003BCD437B